MPNTTNIERNNKDLILVTDYDYCTKIKNNKKSLTKEEFVEAMKVIFARTDIW